ncbi:C-type natriuretic peptide 2-like [Hemicordylus capensis]|uniref:C-type natriuretic peptide 2-like n=1 Tax=Hemicordylus capensis TaxID=884348 RepID=UPI002304272E|nr:C-type natriuretic peptide 2-like [Hemicordylus capensis]
MKLSASPFLFLALLPLAFQTPVRSPQAWLEILGEDLAALLSSTKGGHPLLPQDSWSQFLSAGQRPLWDLSSPPTPSQKRAWARFLNDFVNTQKTFRGRNKKMAQQGCFGIKLDRIGTFSGLGC